MSHAHVDVYDAAKSSISPDTLSSWASAPITDDLKQLPGIGDGNAEIIIKGTSHDAMPVTSLPR